MIQNFGLTFGYSRIVLYIEPLNSTQVVTTDTARTTLRINQQPLPWDDWQIEFIENMPQELRDYINSQVKKGKKENFDDILKDVRNLFKLKFYKKTKKASKNKIDDPDFDFGKGDEANPGPNPEPIDPDDPNPNPNPGPRIRRRRRIGGNLFSHIIKPSGKRGEEMGDSPMPNLQWFSKTPVDEFGDNKRENGDLEGRFAKYIQNQHLIMANADFPPIQDEITRWVDEAKEKGTLIDIESIKISITNVVRKWFGLVAIETVMGVQGLSGLKEWTSEDIDKALSEEALTSAAVHRYHINFAVKRELGSSKILSFQ